MTQFCYFAYGSNMLTQRLQARCPSATLVGPAFASGFSIAMNKKSTDTSGKATLIAARSDTSIGTFGVVFEIRLDERRKLDDAEGRAYGRKDQFEVTLVQGNRPHTTSTYIAGDDHLAPRLLPFCWYRALIIAGAEQHSLPNKHIARLRALPFRNDPEPHRPSRKIAVNVLESAGFAHLLP